jgi:RHS repeat-associated protein
VATGSGGSAALYWVHGNHMGVPLVTTDASGAAASPAGYTVLGFPGQTRTLADLYYNRYRDYDSSLGRYIQADPIGLGGGGNPYLYAGANPLRVADPSGRSPILWAMAFGAAYELGYQFGQNLAGGRDLACIDFTKVAGTAGTWGLFGLGGEFAEALVGRAAVAWNGGRFAANVAEATEGGSPIAGGGADVANLSASDIIRIQNAANRTETEISVVGSRANGTAGPASEWDYVLPSETSGATRHSLSSSLPEGPRGIGEPRNQDFHIGPIDPSRPFITFIPR